MNTDKPSGRPERPDRPSRQHDRPDRPSRQHDKPDRPSGLHETPLGSQDKPVRLPRDLFDETRDLVAEHRQEEFSALVMAAAEDLEQDDFASVYTKALSAKKLGPRTPSPRWLLGIAAYRMGRYDIAARELSAYHRLTGRNDLEYVRADCMRAEKRPDKALEILDEVRRKGLDELTLIETLIVAAGALWDTGKYAQAARLLESQPKPVEVMEHHLRLWYALAESLERAGSHSEAAIWWDLIYASDPEFFDVAERRKL